LRQYFHVFVMPELLLSRKQQERIMKVQASLLCWHLCQTKKETSLPGLVAFERTSGQGVLKG
jgi:hypothetical protein